MNKTFQEVMKSRRSIYAISDERIINDTEIENIVEEALKHIPSAFNSQSSRIVLLFDNYHKQLWDITMETLRKKVAPDKFKTSEDKINSFKAGMATILYFDDEAITNGFADQFKLYAKSFPQWAEQSNGMLQFAIWSMLEEKGLGVNLQHYNPLIDEEVKKQFAIPSSWRMIAQMPLGLKVEDATEKQFESISKRLIIRK